MGAREGELYTGAQSNFSPALCVTILIRVGLLVLSLENREPDRTLLSSFTRLSFRFLSSLSSRSRSPLLPVLPISLASHLNWIIQYMESVESLTVTYFTLTLPSIHSLFYLSFPVSLVTLLLSLSAPLRRSYYCHQWNLGHTSWQM